MDRYKDSLGSSASCAMPEKSEISFVVCGKIVTEGKLRTKRVLASIREAFPESKIILSTWNDGKAADLEPLCDETVLSDPAEYPVKFRSHLNQSRMNTVNIQQITGFRGLSRVRTEWAVKTRTDFVLTGDSFYRFYLKWEPILRKTAPKYTLFDRRVLAPWIFTKDPENTGVAYQMSDFFQFGTTRDLLRLWDGHQEPDEDLNYFTEHPGTGMANPERYNHLFTPEQCLFLNVIKKAELPVFLPRWYCDPEAGGHLPEIKRVYASNILPATLRELQLETRWEKEEALYKKGTFIPAQKLLTWYLDCVDSENLACREFLVLHPEPELGRRSPARKLRMTLREVPFLRNAWRTLLRAMERAKQAGETSPPPGGIKTNLVDDPKEQNGTCSRD